MIGAIETGELTLTGNVQFIFELVGEKPRLFPKTAHLPLILDRQSGDSGTKRLVDDISFSLYRTQTLFLLFQAS